MSDLENKKTEETPKKRPYNLREKKEKKAEKAGIGKRLSFHVGRHTFASHLANAGTPLYMVAKLLGDKSLDMVHRVYTNTERTELIEAMKKLGA